MNLPELLKQIGIKPSPHKARMIPPYAYEKKLALVFQEAIEETYGDLKKLDINDILDAYNKSYSLDQSYIDVITSFTQKLEQRLDAYTKLPRLTKILGFIGSKIMDFNKKMVLSSIEKAVGFQPKHTEKWEKPTIDDFVAQNIDLIKSINRKLIDDSKSILINEIKAGLTIPELGEKIKDRYKVSLGRAQFIAQDQTQKLTFNATMLRHKAMGIKKYKWRTMRDERVRPECKANSNKVFSYDTPPPGGHPSQKPNCRCWAEMLLEE